MVCLLSGKKFGGVAKKLCDVARELLQKSFAKAQAVEVNGLQTADNLFVTLPKSCCCNANL